MTDRLRSASVGYQCPQKMESELSPRKTMVVLVIVVGCFAVLWPKVFYPMLVGSANQHIKPSSIDKTTGCCDVISETDINTIKIMSELCGTIINQTEDRPLTGKEIVQRCRKEVLETCGIDISVVLQEQVRLGQNVKQILDQIRSLNGSLCLKYNYGVAPWRLGVPHRVTVKMAANPTIRQERPLHLRSELVHPAFRERGSAIPRPQSPLPTRPPPRVVEGRPGPIPGMRPTIGGAGHVVPPSKQGTSSMSVIMPIYTIGIVIFFTYTLMKIIFKKQPEGSSLYPPVDPDPHFRKEVFESESARLGPRLTRENISSKLVVNAMSALLDEVDQEMEARRKSSEVASQDLVNGNLSNGNAVKPQDSDEQPTVKVLGMEMTASCEGGKKWSRPESPVVPSPSPPPPAEPVSPPQEIYLEGSLPAQSHLLVADSATEPVTGEDPAVVLSGKMTLSVISLDSENGVQKPANGSEEHDLQKSPESTITPEEEEAIEPKNESLPLDLEQDIQNFLQKLQEQQNLSMPSITLESDDQPQTIEVEKVEEEVDDLLQKAVEEVLQKQRQNDVEDSKTNEINEEAILEAELKETSQDQFLINEIQSLIQQVEDLPQVDTFEARNVEIERPKLSEDQMGDRIDEESKIEQIPPNVEPTVAANIQEVKIVSVEDQQQIEPLAIAEERNQQNSEAVIQENIETLNFIEGEIQSLATENKEPLKTEPEENQHQIEPATSERIASVKSLEEETQQKIEPVIEERQEVKMEPVAAVLNQQKAESEPLNSIEKQIQQMVTDNEKLKTEFVENEQIIEPVIAEGIEPVKIEPVIKERNEEVKIEPVAAVEEQNQQKAENVGTLNSMEKHIQPVAAENKETLKTEPTEDQQQIEPATSERIESLQSTEKENQQNSESVIEERHEEVKIEPAAAVHFQQNVGISEPFNSIEEQKVVIENEEKLKTECVENQQQIERIEPVSTEKKTQQNIEPVITEKIEEVEIRSVSPVGKEIAKTTEESVQKIEEKAERLKEPQPETTSSKIEEQNQEQIHPAIPRKTEEIRSQPVKPTEEKIEESRLKPKPNDEELASDEELVEEIEEVVYEEESEEEEIEVEVEESDEEFPDGNANRNESTSAPKVNGERSEDQVEESKYTTVSGATAAENDISDEELTDEEVDEEEIIEIEEEVEDEDYLDEENDVNHVSGDSDVEL